MSTASDVIGRIVEQNSAVYRASPSRLQEDVSQEAQVASDYRGRLVYELLQNADDAMADEQSSSDRIAFLVTNEELWIANDGRPLTDEDVQGLCGLGASSKLDHAGRRRASIGHKGLGFKSVLEVTDEPTIYSKTLCFTLGEEHARPFMDDLWRSLGRALPASVPAMRFPVAVSPDHERWRTYVRDGFNTAFRFPFRESLPADARRAVAGRLLGLSLTTMLFLKHLEEVEIRVEQVDCETRKWVLSRDLADEHTWRSTAGLSSSGLYRVTISSDEETASFAVAHDADVLIGPNRAGLVGPAWDGVGVTEVSVATPLADSETLPEAWRRFHVFLPTAEPSPYPFLINGAFTTDLSRQQVPVTSDPLDYNAHLIREAARLMRERVIPLLGRTGPEAVLSALDRGSVVPTQENSAAALLHEAIVEQIRSVRLMPAEDGNALTLGETLVPPAILEEHGADYRHVLPEKASWEGRLFPLGPFCAGRWARIAADHGARELSAREALSVLAQRHDPPRATTSDDESGGFELDPVLELCSTLWHRVSGFERIGLEQQAKKEPLFPVRRNEDRTLTRVMLAEDTAFYPPRSARQDLPLRGLRFMSHAICWGALDQNERQTLLADRMKAWTALFDVREFRFETVVQAAVLPALVLHPDESALRHLDELRDERALAAVCQLAGRATKADRPLRYQRLQSDRALFNLSRLPVPCRTQENEVAWLPAYRVYFGEDWVGKNSVERVAAAVPPGDPTSKTLDLAYLAPPDRLTDLLGGPPLSEDVFDSSGDEVDLDEDIDEALESGEHERWIAFLSWIGVNQALRPVHFHDVEDDATGWLTTKNLAQPQGWAFASLQEPWHRFAHSVRQTLAKQSLLDGVVPYWYELHDLDQLASLMGAAERDASNAVADALFAHLARHWAWYETFATCQVALVRKDKWPSQRSKPQKALPEEITAVGDNLWLERLKDRGVCPTSHGPRRPATAWRPSTELERRFRRRNRPAGELLPVVRAPDDVPTQAATAVAERLGVRGDLSPSTFTLGDAVALCERIEVLATSVEAPPLANQLREIKPLYRQLFELLSGHSGSSPKHEELQTTRLLANTPNGLEFLPAREMLYASTPGIRERSGVAGQVATFVIEAEATATAPLNRLFGMRTLEEALEWRPHPGENPLSPAELSAVRSGLRELVNPLLARIRVERTDQSDVRLVRDFVERVEPVEDLRLTCRLDGTELDEVPDRSYFVDASRGEPLRAFVVWNEGRAWPPPSETAQGLAMALADVLGLNLVETFLAFIQSDPVQRRRLLDIAGGTAFLDEIGHELTDADGGGGDNTELFEQGPDPTPAPEASADHEEGPTGAPGGVKPAPAPVPLFDFEDLIIEGDAILIAGGTPDHDRDASSADGANPHRRPGAHGSPLAALGTDLQSLDALGMRIALVFEVHRLRRAGHKDASLLYRDAEARGETLVVDVHSPKAIKDAEERSQAVARVFAELEEQGISRLYPGFDVLVIVDGALDRAIELKSSAVDARVQTMSWNEWKTARHAHARERFWLYIVGNLRSDLGNRPFLRGIRDPFGNLGAEEVTSDRRERAVQLRVREFAAAEHLELGVTDDVAEEAVHD